METIIKAFHIDWQLMVAQLVNFAVVVAVLWFFAFKPLNKIMDERSKKIAKSLNDADAITRHLKEAETEKEHRIKEGRQQAQEIIQEAKVIAEKEREKTVTAAKAEVTELVEQSKQQINRAKEKMLSEAQNEISTVVVIAARHLLTEISDKKIDQALADKAVAAIKEVTDEN
jgi:F-type H+-transporting ATPase subunit b